MFLLDTDVSLLFINNKIFFYGYDCHNEYCSSSLVLV